MAALLWHCPRATDSPLQDHDLFAELELKYKLPAIHEHREFVRAGCFLSYGPNLSDLFKRAAVYADKIIKGARPGDLPVEQPTKFEMLINLKTAKVIGKIVGFVPGARRRGDRVETKFAAVRESAFGTKRTSEFCQ
jgi:putative ABC transport system substrate-binding protein